LPLTLSWSRCNGADCLKISGASAPLSVYPAELLKATVSVPPTAGSYVTVASGDAVCFTPRFPFVDGTAYTVVSENGDTATITRPAARQVATATVVELYPTAVTIPFNQLKLYVHFSAPMSEGSALRHIRVVADRTGDVLEGVFHPMDPELWDPDRRRLTMLFDPARIKRGLAPHREIGYPLRSGEAVRVIVDAAFRDARGAPMARSFERRYEVGPDERRKVDPVKWSVHAPERASRHELLVEFDRPLDHALLQHCLTVTDGNGSAVAGSGVVGNEERSWMFRPARPWKPGSHALTVDSMLEDLAGNSLARVFDRDLDRPEDRPSGAARITVDFAIR
jgi:hypothetical protein